MKLTNSNRLRKKLAAEFVGTFVLVFAGTGAIILNDLSGGTITHLGVAITFGLVILTMIYTVCLWCSYESCGHIRLLSIFGST